MLNYVLLQAAKFDFNKTNQITLILSIRNIIFAIFLIAFFLLGCNNTEKGNLSILPNALRSTENRIFYSYFNYIKRISSAEIPLTKCIQRNKLCEALDFNKKVVDNPDLLFFPATLWQLNILQEKKGWEQQIPGFTKEIQKASSNNIIISGEHIQSIFLPAYTHNRTEELLDVIVNSLSNHIARFERDKFDMNKEVATVNNLDLLLENKIMFFATKETGDPVFQNFAIENTSFLYENTFKNDLRIMSVMLNGISEDNLRLLRTDDFYKLAFGIFGFYQLYTETGIEDYLKYCENIAMVFNSIFNSGEVDIEIVDKINLLSQSLVCLTLFDISKFLDNSFLETSEKIYQNVLMKLESTQSNNKELNSDVGKPNESFRLFYYLLEYEISKQNESRQRIH